MTDQNEPKQNTDQSKESQNVSSSSKWPTLIIGIVVGIIITGLGMFMMMPKMMIVTKPSLLGYEQTVDKLEQAILDAGWSVSGIKMMNDAMAKHGVDFKPRVTLIKLCKAEYAKSVLQTDRYVSSIMPCTISVWEDDSGKVYVSKMNTGLMGKMFGGNIAKVMGGKVAKDEHQMLQGVVKQ